MFRWIPAFLALPLAIAACSRCTSPSDGLRAVPDDPEQIVQQVSAAKAGLAPEVARTAGAALPRKGPNPRTMPAFQYATYESFDVPNPNVVETARDLLGELRLQGIETLGHPLVIVETVPKRDDAVKVGVGLPVPDGAQVRPPLVVKTFRERKVWAAQGAAAQVTWDVAERAMAAARAAGHEIHPPLLGRYSDDDWASVSPHDEGVLILLPVEP